MAMTLKFLMERLAEMAEHLPDDAAVQINGEPVSDVRITMMNPIAEFGEAFGMIQRAHDSSRKQVIDISINGREPADLPVMRYPYQRIDR